MAPRVVNLQSNPLQFFTGGTNPSPDPSTFPSSPHRLDTSHPSPSPALDFYSASAAAHLVYNHPSRDTHPLSPALDHLQEERPDPDTDHAHDRAAEAHQDHGTHSPCSLSGLLRNHPSVADQSRRECTYPRLPRRHLWKEVGRETVCQVVVVRRSLGEVGDDGHSSAAPADPSLDLARDPGAKQAEALPPHLAEVFCHRTLSLDIQQADLCHGRSLLEARDRRSRIHSWDLSLSTHLVPFPQSHLLEREVGRRAVSRGRGGGRRVRDCLRIGADLLVELGGAQS